jgi:HAMP domain-containing protein
MGAVVTPLRDYLVGNVRTALLTLLGAVGFVLPIACANTAHLVLARTIARRKEFPIRAALGASSAQVLRPVLAETSVLALPAAHWACSSQSPVSLTLYAPCPTSSRERLRSNLMAPSWHLPRLPPFSPALRPACSPAGAFYVAV